ncbi:MAG: trimethylamine methyltransferase family protein [Deinococcales bacterium]
MLKNHGAKVEGNLVKIDPDTLMHYVRMAPSEFTQLARHEENSLKIGGKNMVFAPVYGPPYVADYDRGRRQSTLEDFNNFCKLTHMIPDMQHGGGTVVEPNDMPVSERHLDMVMSHITNHNKCFMGSVTHADNARDSVTMTEILFGKDKVQENPGLLSLINVSSPLRHDDRMLSVMDVYAKAKQAMIMAPFTVVGAMSPTTLAATLAQLTAEALFSIAYVQMINPGTPCIMGAFISVVDLRSGAPCFGTPEGNLLLYASAQLARYYKLPYRSGGNFTASRIPDAQAGYESAATMWPTVQAGTNFVLHAAGWLEGGLISGYEKLIIDMESLGMMKHYFRGISLEDEDFAWDAYAEVGPGGHFLGAAHTMRHYETAFYKHQVFNMDNYEKWAEEGSVDTYKRANGIWKQMLSEYEAPALEDSIREELEAFMAWRKGEIRAGRPWSAWQG